MKTTSKITCNSCGKLYDNDFIRYIDDLPHCFSCLYEKTPPFQIYPIGFVKNTLKRGKLFSVQGNRSQISEIHLFPSQQRFLHQLEHERRIDVIFYLHQQHPSIKSTFRRGIDGKKVGVFASRTPDRLTPIAITGVELVKIEGTTLFVKGLDAVNGSPILDIKLGMDPYKV